MTTTVTKAPVTPRTRMVAAILSVVVVAFIAHNLVKGGIPAVSWFNTIVVSKSYPMASMASSIFMFYVMYRNFVRKTMPKLKLAAFFLSSVVVCILGFGLGEKNSMYIAQTNYLNIVPTAVAYIMIQFGLTSQAIARLRPKDGPYALMIITIIFVFLYQSPLGEVIDKSGTLAAIGKWVADNPSGAGYRALWLGCYLGLTGVIVRIFFGRETMRVA